MNIKNPGVGRLKASHLFSIPSKTFFLNIDNSALCNYFTLIHIFIHNWLVISRRECKYEPTCVGSASSGDQVHLETQRIAFWKWPVVGRATARRVLDSHTLAYEIIWTFILTIIAIIYQLGISSQPKLNTEFYIACESYTGLCLAIFQ